MKTCITIILCMAVIENIHAFRYRCLALAQAGSAGKHLGGTARHWTPPTVQGIYTA